MQWQRSISISSVISNLFLIIFLTSSSQFSQVSFGVSGMPSIRTLFRLDLSSSSVNFSITKVGSKRSSSISLRSVWTFLISFFTFAKPSWSSSWVNSRLLVISTTSCEILSRRSLVFVSWDLIISLTFSWWSSNSSLTIFLIVSSKSSLFSSVAGVVGVAAAACRVLNEIFGVAFNLLFNCYEPTIFKLLTAKRLLIRIFLLKN